MHKLIIVDDEHFVRKGMLALIDWKAIDYRVVGEADNGEDALALILKEEPEVVFTDIRMPVFDGIELIKQVKKHAKHQPKFVLISGYDDFQYAQQAVRLGVVDFILKPVNKKEIEETLNKLSREIYEERMEIQTNQAFINHRIFKRIILEHHEPTKEESSTLLSLPEAQLRYVMIDIREQSTSTSIDEQIQHAITHFVGADQLFIHPIDREGYGLILEQSYLPKNDNELTWFFDHFKNMIETVIGHEVFIYIGNKAKGMEGIKKSYHVANQLKAHRYIREDDAPLLMTKDIEQRLNEKNELDPRLFNDLIEHVEENSPEKITTTLHQLKVAIQQEGITIKQVQLFLYQIDQAIEQRFKKAMDSGTSTESPFLDNVNDSYTLSGLIKSLQQFLIIRAKQLAALNKAKYNGEIYKVKRYIDRHFDENLTLKRLANQFYMNPVYLGQLFKKTYGIYFKDYLLQVRIEEAKRCLRQTDLKVYEVAEAVGFGSSDYFVTQFEKIVGDTPSKYRQKITVNK